MIAQRIRRVKGLSTDGWRQRGRRRYTPVMDVLDRVRAHTASLPDGVRSHIEQVRRHAVALARSHGLDPDRAELAASAHDVCRIVKAGDLLDMARRFGIPVTPIDVAFPVFLHGPVGAEVLKRDFGLDDEEALNAVRYHTMGRAGMTPLEQAVFIADKLDPSKIGRYPFLPEVEAAAHRDLDEGMRLFIDRQAAAFLEHGDLVHPGMIDARNDALLALKARANAR